MHFSSSVRLLLLAASAAIPGSNAFVAPNAWTPRGITVVPPSGPQPPTSTSLNVGKIMDAARIVSKVDNVLKRLDDISELDPEEDDDDKTKEILDLTLDVLKVVGSKKFAEEIEVDEENLGKESAIGKAIELVETLINYHFEYANPDTMEYTTYPAHPEVSCPKAGEMNRRLQESPGNSENSDSIRLVFSRASRIIECNISHKNICLPLVD
jgi:hypothetical protein